MVAAARRPVTPVRVRAVDGATSTDRPDRLVTEEPLEIRVHGPRQEPQPLAVTMRTPGNDFELAVGFLTTEQLIEPGGVASVAYCLAGEGAQEYNIVTVAVRHAVVIPGRNFTINASCGLCGATTLDDALRDVPPVGDGPRAWPARRSSRCPTGSGSIRRCSTPPGACTPPGCSPPPVS